MQVFCGRLVQGDESNAGHLILTDRAVIAVSEGVVQFVWDAAAQHLLSALPPHAATGPQEIDTLLETSRASGSLHEAQGNDFFTPALIDLHHHAPQEEFTGTATDTELMEWLEEYTFPSEKRMACREAAAADYARVVQTSLRNGTTTSVYFATIHREASLILAQTCRDMGQRAYVGKVSMDRNSPEGYCEASPEAALAALVSFCEDVDALGGGGGGVLPLVQPILTPRFVPTCSDALLRLLAGWRERDAERRGARLLMTTHVSESLDQVSFVEALAPTHGGVDRDLQILENAGLLQDSVLAHAVYLTEEELLQAKGVRAGIAHCPLSNCFFAHTSLPARDLVTRLGVRVGLGTDVAGGYDPSILNAIRHTVTTSLCLAQHRNTESRSPLPVDHVIDFKFAFWLATVGGAQVLQREDLGVIRAGAQFDALHVSPEAAQHRFRLRKADTPMDVFQKWVNLGDDRHIKGVWVSGRRTVHNE